MKKFLVSYSWLILLFLYFPMMVLMVFLQRFALMRNGDYIPLVYRFISKQDVIDAFVNSMTIADCNNVVTTVLGVILRLHRYKYRYEGRLTVLYIYRF